MASSSSVLSQHYTRILGRGSSRDSSSPYPSETPVIILRVQIISCQDLEAKDRNGFSNPFVVVSVLGKRFQTPVCKRNLNPVYEPKDATFDFPIYTSLVHQLGTLEFAVWDKGLIRDDYLGEHSLPIDQWFIGTAFAFDDPSNQPFSRSLVSLHPATTVCGTIRIKLGFVHPANSMGLSDFGKTYNALMNTVLGPAVADKDYNGVVVLEICGANDLPEWPNMFYLGWDMDPFVQVSIGEEVKRTHVIRHSRNPVWDEELVFHVRGHDLSLPIQLTVLNWERFMSHGYVGEAKINVATLVEGAAKKDLNTWLYPDDLPTMFELRLTPAKKPGLVYKTTPTIRFRARYQPYDTLRKQVRQGV